MSAALRDAAARLAAAGVEEPRREARRLLALALGRPLSAVPPGADPSGAAAARFAAVLARRAAREPFALIAGEAEFWSLPFRVGPQTLLPRADSETLIELALRLRPERGAVRRIIDLGTGTGCLLGAALHEYPAATGIGVDRVAAAAALARDNARRLGLGARAAFLVGDWGAALAGRCDLLLCNPPYVAAADLPDLQPEVARHEPRSALLGGTDGLDAYRLLLPQLRDLLRPDGLAILELGAGQAAPVGAMAAACGLVPGAAMHDLGGVPRALPLTAAN